LIHIFAIVQAFEIVCLWQTFGVYWFMTRLRKLNMLAIMQKQKWASFLLSMHWMLQLDKTFFLYPTFIYLLTIYVQGYHIIKPFM